MDPKAIECGQKGKFQGLCRESNVEPPVLWCTASFSCAPLALIETNRRPKYQNELALILKIQNVYWRHLDSLAGSCEHVNEKASFITGSVFLDMLW